MNLKKVIVIFGTIFIGATGFAKTKGTATIGSDIVKTSDSDSDSVQFAGAYGNLNVTAEDDYITAGGKIYYRLNSSDSWEDNGQKIEIKKALLKFRPFGNNSLEIAGGKLYSYYLPGSFFQLSEIYTGSNRWGKTGAGVSFNKAGFFGGAGVPLTESYVKFSDSWGVNGAIGYDFKTISNKYPVKLGADLLYSRTKETDKKTKEESYKDELSSSVSFLYTPKLEGFISKFSVFTSVSFNSEPYVASSVFKKVANYNNKDLKKSNFASLNLSANLKSVQVSLEAEAGHSAEGNIIPVYTGFQVFVPFTNWVGLKPRFFYYGALDAENSSESKQALEVYPRLWFTLNSWNISAGYDFGFKQNLENKWNFEWKIPVFFEYKIEK